MSSECRQCREGLHHCHGAVVQHAGFAAGFDVECTDDCGTPDAPHAFSLDCDAVGCVCAQPIGSAWRAASSAG